MIRGNVLRIRPGHWWWELIDATPGREAIVNVGAAPTQSEAFRLCCLMLRMWKGRPFHNGNRGVAVSAAIDPDKLARLVADGFSDAELAEAYGSHSPSLARRLIGYIEERGLLV